MYADNGGRPSSSYVIQGTDGKRVFGGDSCQIQEFPDPIHKQFHVELENPHVIEKHQVWVGALGKGPDGSLLNSSYENRSKASYQSSLGNGVVNFARVVPNGLLLFFPSYTVMNICIENWQSCGIWSRIEQYKPVFVEPRHKAEFNTAMCNFYEKINDPTLNGAIFAAVCRGKVSEGLDFADKNGRAVVITGLPFPPRMDPKVNLKMQFLDEMRKQGGQGLTGQDWYRQQATRAVNQAIGRVIRHKDDFGAIILCDNRFGSERFQKELPIWVRPTVKTYSAFGLALRDLMVFFKTAEKMVPAPGPSKQRVGVLPSGVRSGAYFLPTVTRRSTPGTSVPRAATVMDHTPSLRRRSVHEDLSLARMKVDYETPAVRKGAAAKSATGTLIDALRFSDRKTSSGSDTLSDTQVPSYQAELRASQAPSKAKKKIIIKKTGSSSAVRKDTLESAEAYLSEVKRTLSSESYTYFSTTLGDYRKTEDLQKMVQCLAEIFTTSAHSNHLFRRFYRFVRPHHKEQFDRQCRELLGQGCDFQPKDAICKKRSAKDSTSSADGKRVKVDVTRKGTMDTKSTAKTNTPQSDAGFCELSKTGIVEASPLLGQSLSATRPLHPAFSSFRSTSRPPRGSSSMPGDPPPRPPSDPVRSPEQLTPEATSVRGISSTPAPSETTPRVPPHVNAPTVTPTVAPPGSTKAVPPPRNTPTVTPPGSTPHGNAPTCTSTMASPAATSIVAPVGTTRTVAPPGSTPGVPPHRNVPTPGTSTVAPPDSAERRNTLTAGQSGKENAGGSAAAVNKVYVHGERDLGVNCCRCHQVAKIPFKAPCSHVCCVVCWKEQISATKSCPECGAKVKRKNLMQVAFGCRLPPLQ